MISKEQWLSTAKQSAIERIKDELRIPQIDTGQDNLLANLILSATSQVEKDVGVNILDKPEYIYEDFPEGNKPIVVKMPEARIKDDLLFEIIYYEDKEDYAIGNSQFIAPPSISLEKTREGFIIRYPAAEWPQETYGRAKISFLIGLDEDDQDINAIEQLTILMVRFLYNGAADMKPNSAYNTILMQHRRTTSIVDFRATAKGFIDD